MKICTLRNEICTLRNENLMKICTLRNEICTLRNENPYFAKWNQYFAKWKSVFFEMKSVLCEMKICTLRNGNLYFTYNHDRNTRFSFSFSSRHRTASSWCSENADLKTLDCRIFLSLFAAKCFGELSTEHCAFSSAAFGSWWTSFAFDYINLKSPRHHHDPNKFDLLVEFILRDGSVQWKNVLFQYISYLVLHVPRQAAKISNIWWGILA